MRRAIPLGRAARAFASLRTSRAKGEAIAPFGTKGVAPKARGDASRLPRCHPV
ncbi:MAG: hypothetical protein OJF61_001800 [Rhodanobacteraceae bacterium]|nr:MAG: hypothetical protein OJF61_001800 [Rhodanobacteraceae bacterium]